MHCSKTNGPAPRAFVRFPPNTHVLNGNVPKEWTVNVNIFFRRPIVRALTAPAQRCRAIDKASAFLRDDSAATMVEYAFMVMLIALVCVATISSIGSKLNTVYNTVANDF